MSLFRRAGSSSGNSWSIGISKYYFFFGKENKLKSLTICISNPTITICICFIRWFKLSWYLRHRIKKEDSINKTKKNQLPSSRLDLLQKKKINNNKKWLIVYICLPAYCLVVTRIAKTTHIVVVYRWLSRST
jgi:hypothetical protein